MRIVLDVNVVVSGLMKTTGPPGRILQRLASDESVVLVWSQEIGEELRRAVSYEKVRSLITLTDEDLELSILTLETIALPVEISTIPQVVSADPDDDVYLAVAEEGQATFLVTGDKHLLELVEHEGIRIVSPRTFLDVIEG